MGFAKSLRANIEDQHPVRKLSRRAHKMTLTETFIPYNRQSRFDAQIAALNWDMVPQPDAMQQELPLTDLVATVRDALVRREPDRTVFVSSSTFLCYDPSNLNRRLQPDLYVAFGVEEPAIRDRDAGYLPWEVGKQPDFVLELASVSTARNDLTRKRDIYAMMEIQEYWRFDATGGDFYGEPLVGEQLIDGAYEPLSISVEPDGHPNGYSPILGLTLAWVEGVFRIYDPATGEYSQTTEEKLDAYYEQRSIVEHQKTRINEEASARRAAEERIRELEKQLRNLRSSRNGDSV